MKKFTIILSILVTVAMMTNAQIPNGGFEDWTNEGGIEIPAAPWITNNLQEKPGQVTYNPVTKSTDHFPANTGNYSLRMENNITFTSESGEILPYWACAYGYATTAFYPGYNGPSFPVTGHPDTLRGYYKFLPQNNDTMAVAVTMYYQGEMVAFAMWLNPDAATEWSSFALPIPEYTLADSAQIGVAAFFAGYYPNLTPAPYGNSVVYIDNFSFKEKGTSGLDEDRQNVPAQLELRQNYPNPFNPATTIEYSLSVSGAVRIDVYSAAGEKIKTLINGPQPAGTHSVTFNADGLASGIYYYQLSVDNSRQIRKMVLLK